MPHTPLRSALRCAVGLVGLVALMSTLSCAGAPGGAAAQAPQLLAPGGALGDECLVDRDCATGMCDRTIPGGYCTRPCEDSAGCGNRGWCDWDPGSRTGFCMRRCENQRECRSAEFECFSVPGGREDEGVCAWNAAERAPTTPNIGAPCRADVECMAPGALERYCLMAHNTFGEPTGYRDGYCIAVGCSADADCGSGNRCATQGDLRFCATACSADTDCREGYACSASQQVCAPARR